LDTGELPRGIRSWMAKRSCGKTAGLFGGEQVVRSDDARELIKEFEFSTQGYR
jgi:hypothetical protein